MKKTISNYLSKPKKIIPIVTIIFMIIGSFIYTRIGKAPIIPVSLTGDSNPSTIESGSNISLSFAQSGRLAEVLVKAGDIVHKGQVIAKLSAPQAEGAVNQAKGALDLAEAQYASLNVQYNNTKKQQDLIVKNAYQTLLSNGLEGTSDIQDPNIPIISGTYTCNKEGSYILKPYTSGDSDSGFSVNYSGLETGSFGLKYSNSVPIGTCGLQVKFLHVSSLNPNITWTISIPNTKGATYLVNKNAYDLAVDTREKILSELATNLGENNTETAGIAKAQIDAAKGAYEAALGAYQNNLIISPVEGTVNFVDTDLKIGQTIMANKSVISISTK